MLKRQGGNAATPRMEMAEERCFRSGLVLVDVDVDLTVYSDCQVVETALFEEQQFCGVVLYSRIVCINNINICLKWDSLTKSFPHYNNVEAVEILKDETSPQWWGVD